MLSVLEYSEPLVEFLHGSDDSFSNEDDDIQILTLIACILYILYLRYLGPEKLADGELNELFVPLSRAAAKGERHSAIAIPELKIAVAKAHRVLIAKLDTKSQDNEDIALINNQQNKQ